MIHKPIYFDLEELVCPHVYYRFGEMAWQFYDPRQFELLDWLRQRLGPVYVNDWHEKYLTSDYIRYIKERMTLKLPIIKKDLPDAPDKMHDERGLRCNLCSLVQEKTIAGIPYLSGHILGKADDLEVQGMLAQEVRNHIIQNKNSLPYNIRLEKDVSWVHMDCEDTDQKVFLF